MKHLRLFGLFISFILLTATVLAQDLVLRVGQLELPVTSPYTVTANSVTSAEMTIQLVDDPATLTIRTAETIDALPTSLAAVMNASRPEPYEYTKVSLNGVPTLISENVSGTAQMLAVWQGVAYDLTLSDVADTNPFIAETGSAWDTILSGLEFVPAENTPEIIQFEADILEIDQVPLNINVRWTVLNRPEDSNLEFVQVLSNGEVINVELPRDNPFISSQGSGLINISTTGGDDFIDLQVRLRDLDDNSILAVRQILLPVTVPEPTAVPSPLPVTSPVSVTPAVAETSATAPTSSTPTTSTGTNSDIITRFDSMIDLTAQTTTVTWEIAADTVDVVRYQAVGASGQAIIETLPTQVSGTYTFTGEFQQADATNTAIYGIATLSTVISGTQRVASTTIDFVDDTTRPQFTVFETTQANAQVTSLPAQISLTWSLANRPEGSNLEFVQVLPNGTLINAELPRENPFIASSGSGVVNLVASTDYDLSQPFDLVVQVRLVDETDTVIITQDVTIPYVPPSS